MVDEQAVQTILTMEREALRRWAKGDVDGFLEISDPEVTYFDPFLQKRLDGLEALTNLYRQVQDLRIDSYEIIDPKVQFSGTTAILTFNFESRSSAGIARWNTTEVYRHTESGWRIIHTHWSFNKPRVA